ncbi:hypothetical protein DFS33DRAFT_213185 [Desarmillaria ectypa]|nr:hypothetical protein DFS33DRAFT_213185 [Desarmillaria ectypa]
MPSHADIDTIQNIAYPNNLVYLSLYQVVANLYSNSFLATLNSRKPTKMTYIDNFSSEDNTVRLNSFDANMFPLQDPSRISVAVDMWHIDLHITRSTDTTQHAAVMYDPAVFV